MWELKQFLGADSIKAKEPEQETEVCFVIEKAEAKEAKTIH